MDTRTPFPPLLEVRGLSKRYGSRVVAVDDVDVVAYHGEVLGIVGESGSGKSTVLRLLNLEEPADAGTMHLTVGPAAAHPVPAVDLFTLDRAARRNVRVFNIGTVPLLLTVFALGLGVVRARRRAEARS